MALTATQIQNAYVAFFNRPADVAGLNYWSSYAGNEADLLNTFAQSAEYQSLYAGMNNTQLVNAVYTNLFNHAPDVAGLNYWVSQLDNGALSIGNVADAINKGAQGTDADIITNKVAAAEAFTDALDTTEEVVGYASVSAAGIASVKAWLNTVTSDADSVTTATGAAMDTVIADVVAGAATNPGETFTLTEGLDTIVGTTGNDTITGVVGDTAGAVNLTTLSVLDSIDGGAGTDTLKVTVADTTDDNQAFAMTNVENVVIANRSGSAVDFDFSNVTGVKSIAVENLNADVTINTVTELPAEITFNGGGTNDDLNVYVTDAAVAEATRTVTVNVVNAATGKFDLAAGTSGDYVDLYIQNEDNTYSSDVVTDYVINSTGGKFNYLYLNDNDAVKTVTVSGNTDLQIDGIYTDETTLSVDASALNAKLYVDIGDDDAKTTFKGAQGDTHVITGDADDSITTYGGNDIIEAAAGADTVDAGAGNDLVIVTGLTTTDSYKGGDGTDTLALEFADADAADAGTAAGAALRATYSGFEQLRLSDDITGNLDIGKLGFNYLQVGDDVTGGTVSGFTTGATVEFRSGNATQTAVLEVGMTGAATASDDVLNVFLNADLANGDADAVKVGVQGINTVNVNAVDRVDDLTDNNQSLASNKDNTPDDGYVLTVDNAANLTALNITGGAAVSYTLSAGTDAVKTINASESTGNLTVDVSNFAGTERITITGSQGVNTITGDDASFGEKIIGGAKGDIITAGAGADAITGNGGRDAFILAGGLDSVRTSMDKISDFGKVTTAVVAGDNGASMDTIAEFQAAATGKGGADADVLQFAVAAHLEGIQAATDVTGAIADATGAEVLTAAMSLKGVITLAGADVASIDTLAEWEAVANLIVNTNGDVGVFEFNGNTYLFQQDSVGTDTLVELTGVTGVTGINIIGSSVAAAAGDIFVL